MTGRGPQGPIPPPGADALLRRFLPKGTLGLTIIGDLHQEFIELIGETGCEMFGCKATVDIFGLKQEDFVPEMKDVITVGEFYEMSHGGHIIFT